MITKALNEDLSDLLFRTLFSLIFLVLGAEHIFHDELIQRMMPDFLPAKRMLSVICGVLLLSCGLLILIGYQVRAAASVLALFILVVTITVHLPALFGPALGIPEEWRWLWDVFQRSNFIKNVCLLGVCFHLLHHKVGKYSLEKILRK
jgi:uncharacterized membrane protein YphA (DoxX/SURF4 family)